MCSGNNPRWIHSQLAKHSIWSISRKIRGKTTSSVTTWTSYGINESIISNENGYFWHFMKFIVIIQDAITWLLSPLDQSLALLLADNGFDVWLVSTRGTKYSLGHTSLSPDDDVHFLPESKLPLFRFQFCRFSRIENSSLTSNWSTFNLVTSCKRWNIQLTLTWQHLTCPRVGVW